MTTVTMTTAIAAVMMAATIAMVATSLCGRSAEEHVVKA